MSDPFTLLLAFIAGVFCYAVAIKFLPGKQPLEDKFDAFLDKLGIHINATQAATNAALTAATTAANIAATPTLTAAVQTQTPTVAQRAQAEIDALVARGMAAPAAVVPAATATAVGVPAAAPEQTITEWALAKGILPGEIPGFISYAANMPGHVTYNDSFQAWAAALGPDRLSMAMGGKYVDYTAGGAFQPGGDQFVYNGVTYSAQAIVAKFNALNDAQKSSALVDPVIGNALSVALGRDGAKQTIVDHTAGGSLYTAGVTAYPPLY